MLTLEAVPEATPHRELRLVRPLGTAIALLLATGLVAVVTKSAGTERPVATSALAAAADQARSAGSVRMEVKIDMSGPGATGSVSGSGLFDFARGRSSLHMDVPPVGALDFVVADSVFYLRPPTSDGFVAIQVTGELAEQAIASAGGQDPLSSLEQLRTLADVKEQGTEQIRGIEVTRYSGALDIAAALAASGQTDEQIATFEQQIEQEGIDIDATIDVLLDAGGLVHQMRMTMVVGDELDMNLTMDLLDYGAPVEVVVPTADQIVRTETAATLQELQQLMTAIAGG